jgi:spectinomycin phosphotransferase
MLEKPDIQDHLITSRLQEEYGLHATRVTFLPFGADVNTVVYRIVDEYETAYFLKLRKGKFDEITVKIPQFLNSRGVCAIIAPLSTRKGRLWGSLDVYKMILYPFIQGKNGYEVSLSDSQWIDFGMALNGIHTTQVPAPIKHLIPCETYSPRWRDSVRKYQALVKNTAFDDPIATRLAVFLQAKQDVISNMVARADQLGLTLASCNMDFVLCHSDIHPGNLLIEENSAGEPAGLYIVDWDNPIFAPKEHDLTLIGGGYRWKGIREEALFYQGYFSNHGSRSPEVNQMALAYYRYERAIQDIAAFCEQLLLTSEGGEDREQAYQYLTGSFLPGHEVELAIKTDSVLSDD